MYTGWEGDVNICEVAGGADGNDDRSNNRLVHIQVGRGRVAAFLGERGVTTCVSPEFAAS